MSAGVDVMNPSTEAPYGYGVAQKEVSLSENILDLNNEEARYGYDIAQVVVSLAVRAEGFGYHEIRRLEQLIQSDLDRIEAVRRLKEAIHSVPKKENSLNFKENPDLKEAYQHFESVFKGEKINILDNDMVVARDSIPELLQVIDGYARRPTTNIEFCMQVGLVRIMNNGDIIIDCTKEIIKRVADQITAMIRAAGKS